MDIFQNFKLNFTSCQQYSNKFKFYLQLPYVLITSRNMILIHTFSMFRGCRQIIFIFIGRKFIPFMLLSSNLLNRGNFLSYTGSGVLLFSLSYIWWIACIWYISGLLLLLNKQNFLWRVIIAPLNLITTLGVIKLYFSFCINFLSLFLFPLPWNVFFNIVAFQWKYLVVYFLLYLFYLYFAYSFF